MAVTPGTDTPDAEERLAGQNQLLEMVASNRPLADILAAIVCFVERLSGDMLCSILLLDEDGVHIRHGAASSLPAQYIRLVDGSAIGPAAGSCGTAAYFGRQVIVADIATDPLWDDYRQWALPVGLRSCWSTPIKDGTDKVLGTFAMYYTEPRSPEPIHIDLINIATHIAAIAIERKRSEDALRASEARLRAVSDNAPLVLWAVDREGIITVGRGTAQAVLTKRFDDHLGESIFEIFSHRPELLDRVRLALQGEATERVAEVKGRMLEYRLTPMRGDDGSIEGAIGVAFDITDRVRAEAEQRRLLLREREVQAEAEAALDASRLKSEFLAAMSHELRTPLNAIIGFSEIIHDERVEPVGTATKEFVGDILKSARHLLQLINDILDLSKIEASKMQFRPEPVNLSDLVTEVVDVLRPLARERRLQVSSAVDPAVDSVVVDAARFKQVLYNLVSNAVKFTDEGGQIRISVVPRGEQQFRLEVEDTGPGISAEDLGWLFRPFHQLEARQSTRLQGTGLGLALTKRIVEAQGGTIGVESTPGRGSRFYAVLPRTAGHSP